MKALSSTSNVQIKMTAIRTKVLLVSFLIAMFQIGFAQRWMENLQL